MLCKHQNEKQKNKIKFVKIMVTHKTIFPMVTDYHKEYPPPKTTTTTTTKANKQTNNQKGFWRHVIHIILS